MDKSDICILIAIPVYKNVEIDFFKSFVDAITYLSEKNWRYGYIIHKSSFLQTSRDEISNQFLIEKQFTHLLFLDSDIKFSGKDVEMLIEASIKHKTKITCGLYPLKNLNTQYVANPVENPEQRGSLIEVMHAGTGFMLIEKEVFGLLKPVVKQYKFSSPTFDLLSGYFQPEYNKKTKVMCTDDWAFCERARSIGIKTFVHSEIKLGHIGEFDYSLLMR